MDIPIVIVCFNNVRYVKNMMEQIRKINPHYYSNIIILDNCSNCEETIEFLHNVDVKVHFTPINDGPWVNDVRNPQLYQLLPNQFILTDPDLKFHENIPTNFIDILVELSDKYNCERIGLALDISDFEKMYQTRYSQSLNIYEHEKVFWENRIDNHDYELYEADIDTTFCLVNKNHYHRRIRIAGNFTAKHLPWYVDNPIYNVHDNYLANIKTTWISTISPVIKDYIETHYSIVHKNQEVILIENNPEDRNLSFWRDIYHYWEEDTFAIFDRYLDKNKVLIDIGGWIGTTSIYGCRKSKHVYVVEADKESFSYLNRNLKNNCRGNYTCISEAIYHTDGQEIPFGKNRFLSQSVFNDSTSHIYEKDEMTNDCYMVPTITVHRLLNDYHIDPKEISLVKVDIEGGEENILIELFTLHQEKNIPMFIRFHYTWWKNNDLDRFEFLTQEQKDTIRNNPFVSIIFSK